ncbi:DUF6461 domain-containing protein [Actinomadura sp. 9N407]|uniref:DUF6461 domain-containing protein n=1 Tax=Actinomadura sp. 9N407 TaxID=3375154 RepID=UPI00379A40A4
MTDREARQQAHREWTARLRAWADTQGISINQRGRIPEQAKAAYIEATGDDISDILARLPPPPAPPAAYAWLTETFHWQAWYGAQTHALTWISGVDPAEVFAAYPAAEHLGEHRLADVEAMQGRGLAGGARIGDWTFLYLPGEWRTASLEDAPRISRELDATVVTFWQIGSHRDRFGYARDGDLKVEFDPLFPDDRYGTEPNLLTEEMNQAGLLPVIEGEPPNHSPLRALEVARLITGVHIDPEVLDGRFQWALLLANDRGGR